MRYLTRRRPRWPLPTITRLSCPSLLALALACRPPGETAPSSHLAPEATEAAPEPTPEPEPEPTPEPEPDPEVEPEPKATPPEDPRGRELWLEAKWRIAEWGLGDTVDWEQLDGGDIRLCPLTDDECDPANASTHADLDSLRAAIDDIAARELATDEDVQESLRGGVPSSLSPIDRNADIRDIDKMFWALMELDVRFVDDDDSDSGYRIDGLSDAEAQVEIDWLAKRYGLRKLADYTRDWRAAGYAKLLDYEPPDEDVMFGVFKRRTGQRYLCALDAPPGTYCCYHYCDQIGGDDNMAEGH